MEATTVRLGRGGIGPALVPAAGIALAAGTIAYGFAARAEGTRLGASLAPFLWDWRPDLGTSALPAAALLATGLGVALRLVLGSARGGVEGLWAVYEVGNHEAANEYLPALPALDFGTLFFLDTFAEVGTSLPVHAIGHPPGLLLTRERCRSARRRSPWRASSRTPIWRLARGRHCSPPRARGCDRRRVWRSSAAAFSSRSTRSSTSPPGTTRSVCSK